ncbi:cytochrome P450 [Sorangium cellulosum]|uniref:Cytochrome P450 n=1 Tax=Sorangium cellulosum TaxID=56 RepID=A0A4P2Q201_SORCE|nr:cytochrome P450 [Sorangium cellulosum]AUX23260.1 cytochrome P450 [Sorangium cellulosum]
MSTTDVTVQPSRPTFDAFLSWLRAARESSPVQHDEKHRYWQLFSHADILRVLSDPATFSSDLSMFIPSQPDFELFNRGNFVRMDPPKHKKLRDLVSQAFTPRVVSALGLRIATITNELLDGVGDAERFDLVGALAYPLPVIVIAELLGIPTADRDVFRKWADTLLSREEQDPSALPDEAAMERSAPILREMNGYLLSHIRQRRARPSDDLISRLVRAEVDGHRLDDEEIVGFVGLLLIAGHITTTALVGNAVLCLDEHPAAAEELRADPTKLPAAIEEVLRYRAPFPRLARRTTAEVEIGGQRIPADRLLVLWVASANRDSAQFAEPDRFDIHRKPNPHLSFGYSIHFCLGAPLARLEARIALEILLDRYRSIAVARDDRCELHNPFAMVSARRLPVDVVRFAASA